MELKAILSYEHKNDLIYTQRNHGAVHVGRKLGHVCLLLENH